MLKTILTFSLLLVQLLSYTQDWRHVKGKKVYRNLNEAIEHPNEVYNLELYGRNVIPEKLALIAQMKQLQFLAISGAGLSSLPDSLFTLPNIRTLDLTKNNFTAIPEGISKLKTLEYLVMHDNAITTVPDHIGALTNLQTLILPRNKIRHITPAIKQLSQLLDLSLGENELAELPAAIGQLSSLRVLELYNNQLTSLPQEITELHNLEALHVNHNSLTALPANLGNLRNLENLQAGNNSLTTIPTSISALNKLKELGLAQNPLNGSIETIQFPEKLEHLTISGKLITAIPPSLQQAKNIDHLEITGTCINTVPEWINNLTALDWLDLDDNHIRTIPNLPHLKKLRVLRLSNNFLDTLPGSLLLLPRLEIVSISNNQIKHIPKEITAAKSLVTLSIYGTKISNEEYRAFRKRLNKRLEIPHDKTVYFEEEEEKGSCYTDLIESDSEHIFRKIENQPYFMGHPKEWMGFINKNYRQDSVTRLCVRQGFQHDSVVLKFTVRREGGIGNLQVMAGNYEPTKAEARRLLLLSCPYWVPANIGARNINAWFQQTFIFELNEVTGKVAIHVRQ